MMAIPRWLGSKCSKKYYQFPLVTTLRKNMKYNYKCGRHATLFVHHNNTKFQSRSLYNVQNNNINIFDSDLKNPEMLMEQSKAWFYNAIYVLTSPKSSHDYFSGPNNDGHSSREKNDESEREKAELPGDDPEQSNYNQLIRVIAMSVIIILSLMASAQDNVPETSWSTFLRLMLQTGEVERLSVSAQKDRVYVYLASGAVINGREVFGFGPHYSFTIGNLKRFEENLKNAQAKLGIDPSEFIPVKYAPPDTGVMSTLVNVAITVGVIGLIGYFLIGGKKGAASMGRNPFTSHTRAKALIILPGTKKGIGFKDVAGMQEAKEEVKEFVDYLQFPKRFKELGAKIPKGALLCGLPGTGKTLLAKAVATEASVPFLSMAGSDFVEMFSGVGSARVRDLFSQARKNAPCIVYIDEIDAIGRSRRTSSVGGNSEQENTLNQLLVEMDGMNSVEGIVMLASTNRPDVLDHALLRPGRFDRNITIDLPTLAERKDIFEIYLKQLKLGKALQKYSKRLSELTPGKSGADIANICNEAALHAARLDENVVDEKNFEYAIERIIAGMPKRNNPLSPEERHTIAYHEAGHAIVSWMLKYSEPILKISIVPRTNSPFGMTQNFPLDTKLHTNEQLFDIMCTLLGGRVAEAMILNTITTSSEDDLRKVTDISYKQIVTFGMNSHIGPISFPPKRKGELSKKPYSDKMAREIDEEASSLVGKAHKVAQQILTDNQDKLVKLAESLLEKEVLNYDDILNLIGQSPHGDKMKKYYANSIFKSDPVISS